MTKFLLGIKFEKATGKQIYGMDFGDEKIQVWFAEQGETEYFYCEGLETLFVQNSDVEVYEVWKLEEIGSM